MIKPTFEETLKREKSRIFPDDMSERTLTAIAHKDNVLFALEKQIPKKPTETITSRNATTVWRKYSCPSCGCFLLSGTERPSVAQKCCHGCGQKLEW